MLHHKESRKAGGDSPGNLVTLCEACHDLYHAGKIDIKLLDAKRRNMIYYQVFKRKHNRQIHKANFLKGGRKKLNQASYEINGFCLFDKVLFQGEECFIFGRRTSGYFDLRKLDGTVIHRSANYKKLKLLEKQNTLLIERKAA